MFLFNLMNIACLSVEINGLMGLLLLMIYSLFDVRADVILIANKNKTSYDALLDFRFFMLCILCICDAGK